MEAQEKYSELRAKTVPGLLFERAKTDPELTAYRAKKLGIYRERTWSEFAKLVSACALGLRELGLKRGQRFALMGDPCEEYVICELAAQTLGAVTYGIYPTSSRKELLYLMEDGQATIFSAENQEYVDRIMPLLDKLPAVQHVIVFDDRGMFTYEHPALVRFADIMARGESERVSCPYAAEEIARETKPSEDLFIVYTSGTTGDPKGALMSHGKHLAAAYTLIDRYPVLADSRHRTVVYLPLCHVLGKDVAVTLPLMTRIVPHYGENIEDLGRTIFETAPTILFTVPRYLQKYASNILVGIETSSNLKKMLYKLAIRVGRRHIQDVWNGKRNHVTSLLYWICYFTIFRAIMNKIGFDKLQLALSAGAPLSPEVTALWQIYGLNVSEFYGQTETGGAIIAAQTGHFPRPGDVGFPPSCWEVILDDNGEILVRGEDVFEGYWKNPEKTREVLDVNGWLHTGDVGEYTPGGSLKIVDRVRDIIVTSGGKTISPTYVENALRASPYISEVVVFGHSRNYLSALIEIDFDTISSWARLNNVTYTGFTNLAEKPQVLELIDAEIVKANQDLARVEQVKTFRVIPKELDPEEEGEPVTPTRKVKRHLMYDKFQDLVESMYSSGEKRRVASEIGDLFNQQGSD
jgi:long-chain acyl-CoA synthetase